jgi:hypothetical protein
VVTKSLSMFRPCVTIGWWTKNVNPTYVSVFWKLIDFIEWDFPVENSEDSLISGKRKKNAIKLHSTYKALDMIRYTIHKAMKKSD